MLMQFFSSVHLVTKRAPIKKPEHIPLGLITQVVLGVYIHAK